MPATICLLSAVEAAGPTSAVRHGGGAGSGGRLTIVNVDGVPEVGGGMVVASVLLSCSHARFNSAWILLAGRTATVPQNTFLGVGVDIVSGGLALKFFGMKENDFFSCLTGSY